MLDLLFHLHFLILVLQLEQTELKMRSLWWSLLVVQILFLLLLGFSNGESPYRWYNWNITYGDIYPLGVKQQVLSTNALDLKYVCFFTFFFF